MLLEFLGENGVHLENGGWRDHHGSISFELAAGSSFQLWKPVCALVETPSPILYIRHPDQEHVEKRDVDPISL
jgi:hypothetical protein